MSTCPKCHEESQSIAYHRCQMTEERVREIFEERFKADEPHPVIDAAFDEAESEWQAKQDARWRQIAREEIAAARVPWSKLREELLSRPEVQAHLKSPPAAEARPATATEAGIEYAAKIERENRRQAVLARERVERGSWANEQPAAAQESEPVYPQLPGSCIIRDDVLIHLGEGFVAMTPKMIRDGLIERNRLTERTAALEQERDEARGQRDEWRKSAELNSGTADAYAAQAHAARTQLTTLLRAIGGRIDDPDGGVSLAVGEITRLQAKAEKLTLAEWTLDEIAANCRNGPTWYVPPDGAIVQALRRVGRLQPKEGK